MVAQGHSGAGHKSALREFLSSEAAGGIILILSAAIAMIIANSPLYDLYHHVLHDIQGPVLTAKLGPMTPHLWINDGLMVIFFLYVGLEIKRELVDGRLSTWDKRRLPVIAAAAGMAMPAILYLVETGFDPALINGWAIPAATDIAFAMGVLALLGKRAPTSLKLFLVTVAIVDDMGAVTIIALFYTEGLAPIWLGAAAVVMAAMYGLNRARVMSLIPYLILTVALWYAILQSGVHATIAGVLAAFMIPIIKTPGTPDATDSPLHRLEHGISPWSAFLIIPLFGFANAGVSLQGLGLDEVFAPVPLGIAAGLFFGKQIGIFGSVWLSVKLGIASKLRGATWLQIYAVAALCGIGFTMSLFIGALAFPGNALLIDEAKIGVIMGSVASALLGYTILRVCPLHPQHEREEREQEDEVGADGDVESLEDDEEDDKVPA
ncbi:Na+/H+ antiporter NhaA [Sphingomonas sp. 35-24ZXX]|uniref:Na+/H+ antiporter NhaA n=1 Tax=Sphingomonas sp. 35-24ZXX TaxID=1545915 RepID=UPI00068B54F6|nr:Na+/H+ antiporter NhaA [Sphingomonas sp. 35-24ZXX]